MAQALYLLVCVLKFDPDSKSQNHVFKGNLEDMVYRFGAQNSNPLKGYVFKGQHFVYKFYQWTGTCWKEVFDPRPETMEEYRASGFKST
jgi:hypothetical protein